MKGPVPKRSDQKRHRVKSQGPVLKTAPASPVFDPPPAEESWHPLMREWYRSLGESGQSAFMEPSDWATARIAAFALSQELAGGSVSAAMLREFMAVASQLMTTEGARRRLRVELQRGPQVVEDREAEDVMKAYRGLLDPS